MKLFTSMRKKKKDMIEKRRREKNRVITFEDLFNKRAGERARVRE